MCKTNRQKAKVMLSSNSSSDNLQSNDKGSNESGLSMVDCSLSRSKSRRNSTTSAPKRSYSASFISSGLNLENERLQQRIMALEAQLPTSIPSDTKTTVETSSSSFSGSSERERVLQQRIKTLEASLEIKEQQIKSLQNELQETSRLNEEANNQLKKQAAAQLEHFARMSHEIRTPLNCIVGMSSLLVDTKLDLFQEEAVQMITTAGNLLSSIVDDVLDFSKLECGDPKIDVRRCNLQHTFDSVVSAIQLKCDERNRGILVNTLYGISVPKFYNTDAKRLSQILFNLLGNAIKFSPDNNYVDLRVDVVDIDEKQGGDRVLRIKVKDFGNGIDKSDLDKIFEPFRQANEEQSGTVYGGTGLGLPITSKLVSCLGGSMSLDSEKGQWCEFTVDLPFEEDSLQETVDIIQPQPLIRPAACPPAQNLESSCRCTSAIDQSDRSFQSYECADPLSESARYYDPNDTSYKRLHVLITEDNKVNQKVLTKTLNRLGLNKVDVVDNGLKAVEATLSKQYDIVFMDMEMPIMGGKEACRQILSRGDDDSKEAPWIVFLTAHVTEKHQAEAKAAGGKDFLTKPFSIAKIKSFLKAYMKRRWNVQRH